MVERYHSLFKEIFGSLPRDCAKLVFRDGGAHEEGNFDVELIPRKPTAATIRAKFKKGKAYLFFGKAGVFEVPPTGRRYTAHGQWEEIRVLCDAVVRGRYEELITEIEGKIVGGRGKVVLEDGPVSEVWREAGFWPFKKKKKTAITYTAFF